MTAITLFNRTTRGRRAIGELVAVTPFVLLFGVFAFLWARTWTENASSIDASSYELSQLTPLVLNADALKATYKKALTRLTTGSVLYQDLDDTKLLAVFQSAVKVRLDATDLQIANIQSIQPHDDGEMRSVGVRLQVSGAYGSILELLSAVRNAKPRIFVDSLDLVSDQGMTGVLVGQPAQRDTAKIRVVAQVELHSLALAKKP